MYDPVNPELHKLPRRTCRCTDHLSTACLSDSLPASLPDRQAGETRDEPGEGDKGVGHMYAGACSFQNGT